MKFALKILISFTLLFTLTACGNPPDLEDRESGIDQVDVEITTYTGVIETFEIDIYQDGTHQIRTEEGEVVVIQSPKVNLNNYIDQKVVITGFIQKSTDSNSSVFTVEEIEFKEFKAGDVDEYENQKFGIYFEYPSLWILKEDADGLVIRSGGEKRVSLGVYNTNAEVDEFVTFHEIEEGTSVTVAGERSLRYVESDEIRIYIPNTSKEKVYKVIFFDGGKKGEKELFYDLLESIELFRVKDKTGEKCGGTKGLECPEDFRCELESAKLRADGICVSIVDAGNSDCPFVPTPAGCNDYKVKSENKNGCPTNYECLDPEPVEEPEDEEKSGTNETDPLDPSDIIDDGEDEETEDEPEEEVAEESEPEPEPVADDVEEDETAPAAPKIKDGMRLYENPHKDYSVNYPKNYYYRSFGAISGTIWATGFADDPLDAFSDAVISIVILEDKGSGKVTETTGTYSVEVDRDNNSHFLISGPADMNEVIDAMAETVIQN